MKNETMKNENGFANAVRRGFTLVELLVVVAIIGILATGATVYVTGYLDSANKTSAEKDVVTISSAVHQYKISNKNKYPSSLDELVKETDDRAPYLEGGEGVLEDPWGNKYELRFKGNKKDRPYVISAGPDGEFGNDDDIRSDVKK